VRIVFSRQVVDIAEQALPPRKFRRVSSVGRFSAFMGSLKGWWN
jgi:hypothetical protein